MFAVFSSGNAERAANPHISHNSSGGAVNVSSERLGDERPSSTQKKKADSEMRKRNSQRSFVCWVVEVIRLLRSFVGHLQRSLRSLAEVIRLLGRSDHL
jgi:hypothetical protein